MAASVRETVSDPHERGRFGTDEHEIASKVGTERSGRAWDESEPSAASPPTPHPRPPMRTLVPGRAGKRGSA
eukprot:2156173-Prymnesium_polylepis.1